MTILITTKTTRTPGPGVKIDCPACGRIDVPAATIETHQKNSLFWIIPLFNSRFASVSCSACGKTFRPALKIDQLATIGREELSRQLAVTVPFLAKFLVVLGIALAVVPIIGLILALIGAAFTMSSPTRWRTAAIAGVLLSLFCTVILGIGVLLNT
jgi:hypothetical protein